MKRLLTACIVIAITTAPAAAASVFEGTASMENAGVPVLTLGCRAEPSIRGVAGDLLSDRSRGLTDMGPAHPFYSPLTEGAASLLLPGLGQLRMGRILRSRIYFGLEGAAWIAIGGFLWQGYARENAYRDYAMAFAAVAGTSHSDDYYETIGRFLSNDGPGGYNEYVRREARDLYYPDVEAINSYYEQNSITGNEAWRWESDGAFSRYNHLRDGSRSAYRRALYAGVFALALRVVSSVDAVRLARGSGPSDGGAAGKISMGLGHQPGGFLVSITKSF